MDDRHESWGRAAAIALAALAVLAASAYLTIFVRVARHAERSMPW